MTKTVLVYDPAGVTDELNVELASPPSDLAGITVGILDNTKQHAAELMELVAEQLDERFGGIRVVQRRKTNASVPAKAADYAWLEKECDVVLTGSGD
jgi:hypothetical protein